MPARCCQFAVRWLLIFVLYSYFNRRLHMFPQLFLSMRHYRKRDLVKDLAAGLIVGIVAIPLAIAFGIASGVSPTEGLITAIVGGFIVSFLGGSKVQIGGPTGAFIVIVYGIIQQYGVGGLALATLMAGVILLFMGFLRLGSVIRFVPYPIIVGFTGGIAVTIFTTQVKDLLGLGALSLPGDFLGKWQVYLHAMDRITPLSLLFGLLSIVLIFLTPRLTRKIPGSLVAIVLLTPVSYFLGKWGGARPEVIGDHFAIAGAMPHFVVPDLSWEHMRMLLPSALAIAMLGAIESLLSASVADGMISAKHDSNMELVAQGVANMVVPFIGGIPVTGAIARTMTNINNGGRTPIAGLVHSAVLLLILILLGPVAVHIPMAVLAGVLAVVAYNMSGWRSFVAIFRGPREDSAVLLVTFLLTVLLDLPTAIGIGVLLAMLFLLKRVIKASGITLVGTKGEPVRCGEIASDPDIDLPRGVEMYEIEGPFFFGIANRFDDIMRERHRTLRARILRMRHVPFVDATAIYNLKTIILHHRQFKTQLVLSGVQPQVLEVLRHSGVVSLLGEENVTPHIAAARERVIAFLRANYPEEYAEWREAAAHGE